MTNNSSKSVEDYVKKLGVSREETCVVGDWIYTDLKSELNAALSVFLSLAVKLH